MLLKITMLETERLFISRSRNWVHKMTKCSLLLTLLTVPSLCQTSSTDLIFNITEEQSIGTYIGAIADSPYLYKNLNSSQRKQLNYRMLDQSRFPTSLFRVDESTGGIFISGRIDRESAKCYKQPMCVLEFKVALTSSGIPFSNIMTVFVKVVDKNDNPPYFLDQDSGSVVLDISESALVGTVLKLSGAADRDYEKRNTVQRYALTAYNSVFSLKYSTNLDDSSELNLTLLQPLDREVISSYHFSILAFDGGSPPLSAALAVQIRVTDENDNRPTFSNDMYSIEIRDDFKPGQVILTVSANDRDSGDHKNVYYRFSNLQHEQLEQEFHVNEVMGEISVVSQLSPGVYELIVEALDGGNPPLKSQTMVRVKVISSKNNPPSVEINTLSDGSNLLVKVSEDTERGAFVAFVLVEDHDDGPRGDIVCYLDSEALQLEALADKSYRLTLHRAVDRETCDSYNVTVTCSDNGQPPLSTSKSLPVIITDVNDNPPKFRWDTFSHIVPEGNYSNRRVIQVTATDPDMGKNAELIYSIDNSAHPLFRIDPMSGIISATGHLDRETTPVYTFKVYVADRGQSPNTASANVLIKLQDVNDQYPTFNKSLFEFSIPENAPNRTLLGTVYAYDYDKGINGKFDFSYARSLARADPFVVTTDGKIWTNGELDREQRDSYSFTVMVQDKGLPPKITYASVVVTILDINDNVPKIQFPMSDNHTIYVSTMPEPGMVLAKIVAYDLDASETSSLHFSVLHGNEDGVFDVDPTSGEMRVKDVSRLKNKKVYKLVVAVQDYGSPPQTINTTILVDVNFDNNNGMVLKETKGKAKAQDYIVIVACVTSITVVLSIIIIVAICFFFRQDRQYRGQHPAGNNQTGVTDDGEFFPRFPAPHSSLFVNDKLRPCLEETDNGKNEDHEPSFCEDDDNFKMKQMSRGTFRNSQRRKEVKFSSTVPVEEEDVAEGETGSLMSHTYRNVGNFSLEGSEKKPDILKHHLQLISRQANDVGSDTSGDTSTSDSGRGSSKDDISIDHFLQGERDSHGGGLVITTSQLSMHNERYSRFPPAHTPRGDSYKPYYVGCDTCPTLTSDSVQTNQASRSRPTTPSYDSVQANQRKVSLSSSVQNNPVTLLFTPRLTRKGSHASAYKDVSFTPLPQHNQQKSLSTFSLPAQPQISFSPTKKGRSNSLRSGKSSTGDDDTSTTTSGSYTVNPEELRMDSYTGCGVIMSGDSKLVCNPFNPSTIAM